MKERVCQLLEVFQHEFANLSLPCEGRLRNSMESLRFEIVLSKTVRWLRILTCTLSASSLIPFFPSYSGIRSITGSKDLGVLTGLLY